MTWPCFEQNGRHVLRETSALPSFTQCDDVSLCLGRIIGSNSLDFRVECFIMTPFGCPVTRTSRAVMCVSTETRKNVTNHRGRAQNKQSGFERTCPTCDVAAVLLTLAEVTQTACTSLPCAWCRPSTHGQPQQTTQLDSGKALVARFDGRWIKLSVPSIIPTVFGI